MYYASYKHTSITTCVCIKRPLLPLLIFFAITFPSLILLLLKMRLLKQGTVLNTRYAKDKKKKTKLAPPSHYVIIPHAQAPGIRVVVS